MFTIELMVISYSMLILFGMAFILQNALRQQRYVREVTIQYNLCNEPWYASISWQSTV